MDEEEFAAWTAAYESDAQGQSLLHVVLTLKRERLRPVHLVQVEAGGHLGRTLILKLEDGGDDSAQIHFRRPAAPGDYDSVVLRLSGGQKETIDLGEGAGDGVWDSFQEPDGG